MYKGKFTSDVILSSVATAMPLITLQFVVFPLLAIRLNEDIFGFFITTVGIATIISSTFGGALNNIRLLLNSEYENEQISGDFNLLLCICCGAGLLISLFFVLQNNQMLSGVGMALFLLIPLSSILATYYNVAFRLEINYKKFLINNIIESVGFLAGYGLFLVTNYWQFIYILGFGFSIVYYISLRIPLMREPILMTHKFKKTFKHLLILIFVSLLSSSLIYIDRLILYPLLGGEAVSIYYAATVVGKLILAASAPVGGVMLSYFARMSSINKKILLQLMIYSSAAGVVGYFICIIISPRFLSFLYPAFAGDAIRYIYITTLTAVINVICTFLNPVILSFYNLNWQIIINVISIAIYLLLSILLLMSYGLMGFCIGALVSSAARFLLMTGICFLKKQRSA